MKLETYKFPKSSFLSMEKDLNIISSMIMKNENLKKLLYYTTKDCLSQPKLTEEQTLELFGKNIKIVPKLMVDPEVLNYVVIGFSKFATNATNPEFRNNEIEFDIVCHFDQWQLKDFQLRPYRIAAEIDSMFNNRHLTGIGLLEFQAGNFIQINSEFAGICLTYLAIHGEEDKKKMPNPNDEIQFITNFDAIFNDDDNEEL